MVHIVVYSMGRLVEYTTVKGIQYSIHTQCQVTECSRIYIVYDNI